MNHAAALIPPFIICTVLIISAYKGVDIYSAMLAGAKKGLYVTWDILPALLVLFPAVYLLRASGIPEYLVELLSPVLQAAELPEETSLLMLLRPLSGSGALGMASEIIEQYGVDSLVGRTAAVMTASSETTLYVAAVYLGAAKVRHSRWVIPAALAADLACFISSAWICRLLWG